MERKLLFRLCHVCQKISEAEQDILRCLHCGKGFLPLNYFERIRKRAQEISKDPVTAKPGFELNPLNGLIVFW